MKTQLIVALVAAPFFGASAFAAGDAARTAPSSATAAGDSSFVPTPVPNSPSTAPSSPSTAPSSPSPASFSSWTFWKDDTGSGSGTGPLHGVPGPIAGAGLPFLLGGYGVYWLIERRRRKGNH